MTYSRHFSTAFLEGSFKTTRVAHLSLLPSESDPPADLLERLEDFRRNLKIKIKWHFRTLRH